jgi:hypothetical protein
MGNLYQIFQAEKQVLFLKYLRILFSIVPFLSWLFTWSRKYFIYLPSNIASCQKAFLCAILKLLDTGLEPNIRRRSDVGAA